MARSVADLAPKRNDAYTVLLAISMTAIIAACLLLWSDIQTYPTLKPGSGDTAEIKPPPPTVAAPPAPDASKAPATPPDVTAPKAPSAPPAPAGKGPGTPPAPPKK